MREQDIIAFIKEHIQSQDTAESTSKSDAVSVGIGDDCCIWTTKSQQVQQCLSTDTIIEAAHFTEQDEPALVGRKAAAAALSDIAAMGARPLAASLSYQFTDAWDHKAVLSGFIQELERHQCQLLGGDTVRAQQLGLSVTVWGEAPRMLTRSGGQTADVLVVTGYLGGSLLRGRHLVPEPRILEGQWLAQQEYVHALMDISDGLAKDLPRLAEASGCGCLLISNKIPIHDDVPQNSNRIRAAIGDGEDFELLMAIDAQAWPCLYQEWPFNIPVTMIGMLTERHGVYEFEDEYGRMDVLPQMGFEH